MYSEVAFVFEVVFVFVRQLTSHFFHRCILGHEYVYQLWNICDIYITMVRMVDVWLVCSLHGYFEWGFNLKDLTSQLVLISML